MVIPSPFVYWAQTENVVTLRVDLKNVKKEEVNVLEKNIRFSAEGIGARGICQYQFSLDLFDSVKTCLLIAEALNLKLQLPQIVEGASSHIGFRKMRQRISDAADSEQAPIVRIHENRVDITLQKKLVSWWPRLTAQPQKPAWLKINFDLWKSEDGLDSEEDTRDVMKDYPGMYDKLHKEEMGYRKEDFKKVYLVLYNLFQFIGYMYILTVMGIRYAKLEYDSVADTYEHVGSAMKFLQLMQYLEVMHPLFGYTKGSAFVPFLQVSGRAFILFAMIEAEPRMQTKPVVFYLFIMWSMIEVVRYPFYIAQLYKKEFYILTWLRYTMWIPLYPFGIICESIVIIRNIPYFEETQRFTVSLPNEWNFAFHLPSFLRIYLLLLTFPGMYFVMTHMHKLRTVKLKPKVVIKKVK